MNSTQPDLTVKFEINGEPVLKAAPLLAGAGIHISACGFSSIDGIGLTPDATTLYYCSLTGRDLWAIPTELLRDFTVPEEVLEQNVQFVMVHEAFDFLI